MRKKKRRNDRKIVRKKGRKKTHLYSKFFQWQYRKYIARVKNSDLNYICIYLLMCFFIMKLGSFKKNPLTAKKKRKKKEKKEKNVGRKRKKEKK